MNILIKGGKKVKRIIAGILAAMLTLFSLLAMTACGFKESFFEDEYFKFRDMGEKIYIVGLTELGAEQEVLVVPSEVNGYPVTQIGQYSLAGFSNLVWWSDKLKKVFIPNDKIKFIDYALSACENLKYIVFSGFPHIQEQNLNGVPFRCFYQPIYESLSEQYPKRTYTYRIANIEFLLNYKEGTEDVFWLDIESGESLISKWYEGHYAPTREGYTFDGWYKEPDCINAWNFLADKTPAEIIDEETGKATTQITRLYAKWIKY